ncbi:MAG: aminomethyl-transferring glycine dehydrogenase subunit GcvPB [Deltaproteobacteria bacterium]|nr:aminomethyl-transferring glycine dehydrogenase subunit GcvPB [Deltaproteobacteria bacterium]MBI4373346.1 aminomethyl-transferring glycine dehydrogenase subunit GcvPB [Deltaproteobacteria bacterium]
MKEPLIFELSREGREGFSLPSLKSTPALLPANLRRARPARLPEVSEPDVVRHFTRLSQWNFSIDTNFYPLGSCTMKYNPRINEEVARYAGFAHVHPYQPAETIQGCLQLMSELEAYLAEISGMDAVTLQPAAGAHGELTGILMIRAYLESKGNPRKKILIPDSAHGTNPASSAMGNYSVIPLRTSKEGRVSSDLIRQEMNKEVAAIMLTNPNTLGLFESEIQEIARIVHEKGGLVYGDGANMNAILGKCRPGDLGIDVLQFNLHKTFTTPHGGGGPGAGPVAVKRELEPFLPVPRIVSDQSDRSDIKYTLDTNRPQSIGRIRSFFGNFGMFVRAYTYIREMGPEGLKKASELAVLNANYIRSRLESCYHLPYVTRSLHEVVFSDKKQKETGVSTLDIAKRLLDYGYHPPTIYFPLVVMGAMMIEPTETESKETIDKFCDVMTQIAKEAQEEPDTLHKAPHKTHLKRLNEAKAARDLKLRFEFD